MYTALKSLHLTTRYNADVAELLEKNHFTDAELFNIHDENWRIAFTLEDYLTSKMKMDPRYVKFYVRTVGKKDGVPTQRAIPFHRCTNDDLAEFDPVEQTSNDLLKALTTDPDRGLFCIEWDKADINLHGNENKKNYEIIEIMVLPCNHRLTHIGDTEDRITEECVADLDAQIEYLGPLNLIFYYDQKIFKQDKFYEYSIEAHSAVKNIQADEYRPNWFQTFLRKDRIEDETSYF